MIIEFDLNGRKLALEDGGVRELRERALARAGSSSTLNDLAVILARALAEQKLGNAATSRVACVGTPAQLPDLSRFDLGQCARLTAFVD